MEEAISGKACATIDIDIEPFVCQSYCLNIKFLPNQRSLHCLRIKMYEGVINTEAKALVATIDNQAAIPHCWSTSELLIKYQKVLF